MNRKIYFAILTVLLLGNFGWAQTVSISAGATYTQNFDSVGAVTAVTLPYAWKADRSTSVRTVATYSGASNTITCVLGGASMATGASNGFYNFGAGTTTNGGSDRALGGLSSSSSTKSANYYTTLKNDGGSTISSFTISYKVEKYRLGSNAAGFRIQMYYSTDGSTWTAADTNSFMSKFASDGSNAGLTPVPGDSIVVSNKTLSVSLNAGSQLYLAWNYAVYSGTTTSNAQALGIDDISITAVGATLAPTTQVSSLTFNGVQTGQFGVSWTNGNGTSRIVKINTSNSFTNPTDGGTYTANSVYGGSGEQTVYNASSGALTVTGLSAGTTYYLRAYEYNGTGSGSKFDTATATGNPASQATTAASFSTASDIIANGSFTAPTSIDYKSYQEASLTSAALEVAKFDIRDGAGSADADAQPTTLNSITFSATNSSLLRSVALFDGSTKLVEVAPSSSMTFNGLTLAAADGGSKSFSIRVSFLATVTDNQQFSFTVTSATANAAGSTFAAGNAGGAASSTGSGANTIVVAASKLNFVQQPSTVAIDATMSPAVTVEAVDANNNRDLDYVTSVSLTANGTTLTGSPVSATPVSGLATFSSLVFTAGAASATLTAASSGITNATSSAFIVQAPTTYTWVGGTNAFATASNWSPARSSVLTNDILLFNNGTFDSVVVSASQTIGKLTVTGNTTVKLVATAATTLTIGNGAGTDLNVDAGSALNLSGASFAITLGIPTGATGSISGTMLCEGAAHKLIPVDSAAVTFQSGSVFTQNVTGNIFNNSGTANAVIFVSGATFVFQLGSNPFALSAPSSRVLFKSGSTYRHESSNSPSLSNRTYANFTYNYSGTISTTGATGFTCENLTASQGTLNLNMTAVGTIVKGNISVASGATLGFSPASAGAITLNGTATQTITNAGTLTFGANATLTINNPLGVVLYSDASLAGNLALTSGVLVLNGSALTLSAASAISGTPSSANMIVPYNGGSLKKILTGAAPHSFTFPVGDVTEALVPEYSPVDYTLNSGTFTADTIGVKVSNAKHASNTNMTNFISRSWTLTCNGVTSPNYTATFTYLPSDITGTESLLNGNLWNGATWSVLSAVNTGTHTFAATSQTVFGDYTAFSAAPSSGNVTVSVIPQGYYNAGDYLNSTDTVSVLLADASTYVTVDSTVAVIDSISFAGTATFSSAATGSYYLVVKQRTSVETWSATTVAFAQGSTIAYDFTDAQNKAYGDNQVQVNSSPERWAIYGGDSNQDGYVDPLDMSLIDQDSFNYVSGAGLATDINGDLFVDPLDMSIADQNSFNYAGIKRPTLSKQVNTHVRPKLGTLHFKGELKTK